MSGLPGPSEAYAHNQGPSSHPALAGRVVKPRTAADPLSLCGKNIVECAYRSLSLSLSFTRQYRILGASPHIHLVVFLHNLNNRIWVQISIGPLILKHHSTEENLKQSWPPKKAWKHGEGGSQDLKNRDLKNFLAAFPLVASQKGSILRNPHVTLSKPPTRGSFELGPGATRGSSWCRRQRASSRNLRVLTQPQVWGPATRRQRWHIHPLQFLGRYEASRRVPETNLRRHGHWKNQSYLPKVHVGGTVPLHLKIGGDWVVPSCPAQMTHGTASSIVGCSFPSPLPRKMPTCRMQTPSGTKWKPVSPARKVLVCPRRHW